MSTRSLHLFVFAFLFVDVLSSSAQPSIERVEAARESDVDLLSVEVIQAKIAELNALGNSSEEDRASVASNLDGALKEIQRRIERQKQRDSARGKLASIPGDLESLDRELRTIPSDPPVVKEPIELSQLQASLAQAEAELLQTRESLRDLRTRLDRRPKLLAEFPANLQAKKEAQSEWRTQLDRIRLDDGGNEVLTESTRLLLQARLEAAEADIEAAEAENILLENSAGLWTKRVEVRTKTISLLERQIEQLRTRVSTEEDKRQKELARRALIASANEDERIQEVIAQNRVIAEGYNNTPLFGEYKEKAETRLQDTLDKLNQVEDDEERTRKRLQISAANDVVGAMMRASRTQLPDTRILDRRLVWTAKTMQETSLQKIEIDEKLDHLADIDKRIGVILGAVKSSEKSHQRLAQEEILRGHLQTQRELLQAASKDYESLINNLVELDAKTREAIRRTNEYESYLAERIIWLRDAPFISLHDFEQTAASAQDLASPRRWLSAAEIIVTDFARTPATYILTCLLASSAIFVRRRLRRVMRQLSEQVSKDYVNTPHLTLSTFALTLIQAGWWPAIFSIIGYRLLTPIVTIRPEVIAIGQSLVATSGMMFLFGLLSQICRPSGLGPAHFRWKNSTIAFLRRNLRWLSWIMIPLTFALSYERFDAVTSERTMAVRMLFAIHMVALSFFLFRTFRRSQGVLEGLTGAPTQGFLVKSRIVWYPLIVTTPWLLVALASAGYMDTALFLQDRLLWSLALGAGVIVFKGLLLRWLFAVRGRLALAQTRKRREAEEQGAPQGNEPFMAAEMVDLSAVNAQTRRLLSLGIIVALLAGLSLVWSDVVPALRVLDRVQFWSKTEKVWETRLNPETQTTQLEQVERTTPVTLGTFMVVIVIVSVTIAASRNVPGFLELTLLKRLPLDTGARYAVSAIVSYAISIVGLLLATSQLGINWNNVQWLAAAFTVGLGFGLQEIVSNFVSGLILLAERPIRIGDIVTVGDLNGTVSKIKMRATTIVDFNRKELIVPNREFITGRFVNWTLSDRMLRLTINVGVSYGTDVRRVIDLLLEVANRQLHVLKEPKPAVIFEGFGDSALNFCLFAFVDNLDNGMLTKNAIYTEIYEGFNKLGIEFPFPQRDLNVKFDTENLPVLDKIARPVDALRASA